jgi:hypothetical protein
MLTVFRYRGNVFTEPLPRSGSGITAHITIVAYQRYYTLLIMRFSLSSCYILSLRPKHSSQHRSETFPKVRPTKKTNIDTSLSVSLKYSVHVGDSNSSYYGLSKATVRSDLQLLTYPSDKETTYLPIWEFKFLQR